MTTLITDEFDGEEEFNRLADEYRNGHKKQMTDVAKVLHQARIAQRNSNG